MSERIIEEFQRNYKKLVNYKKIFDHCYVPANWHTDPEFAKWVESIKKNKEQFNREQIKLLEKLNFDFSDYKVNSKRDVPWKRKYEKLKLFFERNGHSRVTVTDAEDRNLAKWVTKQRQERARMPKEKKDLLESINFVWREDLQKLKQYQWLEKFRQLKEYKDIYGTLAVKSNVEEFRSLRLWVDDQRKKGKKLSSFQKGKLKSIDFPFSQDIKKGLESAWENRYQQLKEFFKEYGHSRVPANWKGNPSLAIWVQKQRHNRHKLSKEQKQKLYRISFYWSDDIVKVNIARWEKMYGQLQEFYKRFGHCRVPESWKENRPLGDWVYIQRQNKPKLSKERISKLDKLSFTWKIDLKGDLDRLWIKRYNELYEYYERFGHCRVPEYWKENEPLSIWVKSQREKESVLSKYRRDKLNKINFLWKEDLKSNKLAYWDNMYAKLKDFFVKNGHSNVPSNYKADLKLAGWVTNIRRKAKLTQEQTKKLDKLNFIWVKEKSFAEQKWEVRYEELRLFYNEYGHSRVPDQWKENKKLAGWVSQQRARKKKGLINEVQIEYLDKLDFVWKAK